MMPSPRAVAGATRLAATATPTNTARVLVVIGGSGGTNVQPLEAGDDRHGPRSHDGAHHGCDHGVLHASHRRAGRRRASTSRGCRDAACPRPPHRAADGSARRRRARHLRARYLSACTGGFTDEDGRDGARRLLHWWRSRASHREAWRGRWPRRRRTGRRWSDVETRDLSELDALVYAPRLIGAETSLVVWGGGNTSIKTTERDHRDRPVDVLRVKGSGSDLKSIQRKDFPGVRMDDIRALLERQEMDDQAMVSYLARALQEPGGPRPSIETLLHGFVESRCVVHTHADAIVSLTNNDRAADTLEGVYGKDVIALDYRRPGFRISREVAGAIAGRPDARALVLAQHGTITWGATVRAAHEATIELIPLAEEANSQPKRGRRALCRAHLAILPAAERRALA